MSKPRQPSLRSIQAVLTEGAASSRQATLLEQNRANSRLLDLVRDCLPAASRAHCHAARFSDNRLVIHSDSPAWSAKLRFQLPAILPALRRQPGLLTLRDAIVRTSHETGAAARSRLHAARMDEPTAAQIRELASAIRDEGLRKRWLKLAEHGKK